MRGKFITFEGPDGSGKGTLIKNIVQWFEEEKLDYILTKEPGSPQDSFCPNLRQFILDPENDIDNEAEIYLYMADRCQHVNRVVLPALKKGKIVLCDRYIDSTYAYQGFGRRYGVPDQLQKINYLNRMTTNNLLPDLTIILMVNPQTGLQRITTKEFGKPDRLEKEALAFHERVYQGYQALVEENSQLQFSRRNIATIDTTILDADSTFDFARGIILGFLNGDKNAHRTL